ncbi:hypothetical protein [Parafrankia discariae]|uniref:hypothetical protein n=1 Tax=Parafrankia discariae TaxID=365528 RepID=UPI00035F1D49|nr:hypothetical protein [Parafrankia discariae]
MKLAAVRVVCAAGWHDADGLRTGLAGTSVPVAQPPSDNPLPVSTYTDNHLNQILHPNRVLTEVETVNSTTRTTTFTYDTAGRKTSEAITASPAANGGTAISTAPTATTRRPAWPRPPPRAESP